MKATASNTQKLLAHVPLPDEIATVHDNAVVVDIGSGFTKIGFSGDDSPRLTIPTVSGRPTGRGADLSMVESWSKAFKMREKLNIMRPMERGEVKDWDMMERMLTTLYSDVLKFEASEPNTPLLLSEGPLVPREQREMMAKILFEKVGVQSLYFALSPVMSLYSSGKTTGMVVEMGYGSCTTVPVFEGFGLFHSILQLDLAGADITNYVSDSLGKQGLKFPAAHEKEIAQFVKEKLCEVPRDRDSYHSMIADRDDIAEMTLPDGTKVHLGPQRYTACEALFDPSLFDLESKGIHALAVDSTKKCDSDIMPSLYSNVMVAGGTSLFRGLHERLTRELVEAAPMEKVKVNAGTERKNAAWVGGSILASIPTFQDMWITKADFEEVGVRIVHRNCF
eukprot:PhF_6_TR40726/c0_g1_i1/m.61266/K05692/ACTB_G1; actin beta/gamma 1